MSAKNLKQIGLSWACLAVLTASGSNAPRGNLIEVHSCEVYAGGCVVSSEAPQGGRYMVQVWDISSGAWEGVDLSGLQVAVLQVSQRNLAMASASTQEAVVYLPERASSDQRSELLAWLKSREPRLEGVDVRTRAVALSLQRHPDQAIFRAGEQIALRVGSVGECKNRLCGEDLWYAPRGETTVFTVGANLGSQVDEPFLRLKWGDHGKRSVFLGRFGEAGDAKSAFVQSSDWCGSTAGLF